MNLDDLLTESEAKLGAKPALQGENLDDILASSEAKLQTTPAAAPANPSLWDRTKQSFSDFGHAAASTARSAVDLVSPVSDKGELQLPFSPLLDSHKRRQLERGVSDMMGGVPERIANEVPETILGKSSGAPSLRGSAVEDEKKAPDYRALGQTVGLGVSPFNKLGGVAAKAIPEIGPLTAAARGLTQYEATAVPMAATNAAINAPEGERVNAALEGGKEAATNPAGVLLGAGIPGATKAAEIARENLEPAARARLIKAARVQATKDIGKDIVAAEGPRARVTDQKRIAEVNDRLFEMTKELPELRETWRKPAEKALPEIQAAKRAVAEPLDGLYDKVDRLTADTIGVPEPVRPEVSITSGATQQLSNPNWPTTPTSPEVGPTRSTANHGSGGVRLGDIIDGFEADAVAAGKKASGQAEAQRFREVKKNFLKAYGEPVFDPSVPINEDGTTAGQMLAMLEKAKARNTPGVDEEITRVREMATSGTNLDKRIPTKEFRAEVTDLHKTAEAAMGGLEGTARHEALSKLYDTGKRIIDEHLDSSGLEPEELAQLRKANNRYFLLSRAEAAIESRGWKESNRPHGFAHSVNQAVHGGSLSAAAVYAAMHPHAIPALAATYGAVKAAPAVASRANWALANMSPTPLPGLAGVDVVGRNIPLPTASPSAAVARLVQAGRAGATRAQLQNQAQQDGVDPATAERTIAAFGP